MARSPFAESWTLLELLRSMISSSIVSVPTIERSEPSRTFLTIESTCSSSASRKRSAALRIDSSSPPILNVATPWTATLMPWLVTASARSTLIWRAVSLSLPTLWTSGSTSVPAADHLEPVCHRWPSCVARPLTISASLRLGDPYGCHVARSAGRR